MKNSKAKAKSKIRTLKPGELEKLWDSSEAKQRACRNRLARRVE